MFGIGTTELLVIFVVALVVLGPKKLPQAARSLGKAFGEFKRVSNDVKRTIDVEVDRLEKEDADDKARKELRAEDSTPTAKAEEPYPEAKQKANYEPNIVSPVHAEKETQDVAPEAVQTAEADKKPAAGEKAEG
jgi:sec-independent protein translocase protein TatB